MAKCESRANPYCCRSLLACFFHLWAGITVWDSWFIQDGLAHNYWKTTPRLVFEQLSHGHPLSRVCVCVCVFEKERASVCLVDPIIDGPSHSVVWADHFTSHTRSRNSTERAQPGGVTGRAAWLLFSKVSAVLRSDWETHFLLCCFSGRVVWPVQSSFRGQTS